MGFGWCCCSGEADRQYGTQRGKTDGGGYWGWNEKPASLQKRAVLKTEKVWRMGTEGACARRSRETYQAGGNCRRRIDR